MLNFPCNIKFRWWRVYNIPISPPLYIWIWPVVHMGKQRPKIARQIGREWLIQVLFPHCHSLLSHCHQNTTQWALPLHPWMQRYHGIPKTSKVPGPSPSAVLLHDSPHHLPCHLLCVGVVLGRCTQGGGTHPYPSVHCPLLWMLLEDLMLQASIVVPICPLPVLLQPIRRGGEAMWTLMTTALLHCCPNLWREPPGRSQQPRVVILLPLPKLLHPKRRGVKACHQSTKMMSIWIVMMTALPHCFSCLTGRSQQGSVLVLVCPLPVLLHPKRRGREDMWTVMMTQCLLHLFLRQGTRVVVVLSLLVLLHPKRRGGLTIHCLSKMRMALIVAMRRTTRRGIMSQ